MMKPKLSVFRFLMILCAVILIVILLIVLGGFFFFKSIFSDIAGTSSPSALTSARIFSDSTYGFDGPAGISIDNEGNAWITNQFGNTVTEIKKDANGGYSPVVFSRSAYRFNFPDGICTDSEGNVWVVNDPSENIEANDIHAKDSVTEMRKNPDGTYHPIIFSSSADHLKKAQGIAADSSGNIWVGSTADSITEIKKNADGSYRPVIFSGRQYGFNGPQSLSADVEGNIWITNYLANPGSVTELQKTANDTNASYHPVIFSGSAYGFTYPGSLIAADNNGNIWVGLIMLKKNSAGDYQPTSLAYSVNAVHSISSLTTDSAGNVWIASQGDAEYGITDKVVELKKNAAGQYHPVAFYDPRYGFSEPTGISADQAGNIWVANGGNDTVTELINP